MTIAVGIKYILDDREFRQKVRSSNNEAQKLTKTNQKHLKTIKQVQVQEKRGISSKKRELDLTKKQTREIVKQDQALKRSNNTRKVAGGRTTSSLLGGLAPFLGVAAVGAAITGGLRASTGREASLTQFENIIGRDISSDEKKRINRTALETGQSLEGIYGAIYSYASSFKVGDDITEALNFVREAGISATGGGGEIGETTAAMIKILKAAPELTGREISKVISGTVQVGSVYQSDVSANAGKFLGVATKSAGFDINEASAIFGMISQNVSPEEAATLTKAMSRGFAKPTKRGKELGITTENLRKEGFAGILKRLEDIDNLFDVFASEETVNAFLLSTRSVKEFKATMESYNSADPLAQFERATNDAGVQFTRFKTSMGILTDAIIEKTGVLGQLAGFAGIASELIATGRVENFGTKASDLAEGSIGNKIGNAIGEKIRQRTSMGDKFSNNMSVLGDFLGVSDRDTQDKVEEVTVAVDSQTERIEEKLDRVVEAIEKIEPKPAEEVQGNAFVGPIQLTRP